MVQTIPEAGYRFIPGVYQYSAGVAAEPGFRLERVRFVEPLPLMAGFARIAAHLESLGRPKLAFAACELRSPRLSRKKVLRRLIGFMAAPCRNGACFVMG